MNETEHKPLVLIQDAHIGKFGWAENDVLMGTPLNHPNERLNGKLMHSSTILSVQEDVVETKNTKYLVANWKSINTLLRSNRDGE